MTEVPLVQPNSINNDQEEPFSPHGDTEAEVDDVTNHDEKDYPRQQPKLVWTDMNKDFQSTPMDYKQITHIAQENGDKYLDMRPYMIEKPH